MLPTDNFTNSPDEWVKKLLGNEKFKPGLDRLKPIFKKFIQNFKERKIKIITIAGTNGKGETSFALECLLQKNGHNVALWTSPHILHVKERFRFLGKEISENKLIKSFNKNEALLGKLSYYEYLFFCFCDLTTHNSEIDTIIFEVGLGGRLDAVNLFDADFVGLTSIAKDHEEFLGSSLKGILIEKLGVTRAQKLCIFNLRQKFLQVNAVNFLNENNVPFQNIESKIEDYSQNYSVQNRILAHIMSVSISGKSYSKDARDVDLSYLEENLILKGRFENAEYNNQEIVFNGAHNLDGVKKLRDLIVEKGDKYDLIIFSPSNRSIQDIDSMIKVFLQAKCLYNEFVLSTFEEHPRACSKEKLLINRDKNVKIVNWKHELSGKVAQRRRVLITGSYYFIGEVQKFISL